MVLTAARRHRRTWLLASLLLIGAGQTVQLVRATRAEGGVMEVNRRLAALPRLGWRGFFRAEAEPLIINLGAVDNREGDANALERDVGPPLAVGSPVLYKTRDDRYPFGPDAVVTTRMRCERRDVDLSVFARRNSDRWEVLSIRIWNEHEEPRPTRE